MSQVYRLPARTIARALERKELSQLAEQVLEACAKLKKTTNSNGRAVFVRLDFPQDEGGMEIRCYKWSWLSWFFAGRALDMWRDEE